MRDQTDMTNQISNISFSVSPEATASTHPDGLVILHTGTGFLFSSNRTGARIWQGVEQRHSLNVIVQEISGEFEIAQTTARMHTINFLAALEQQALIKREAA